MTLVLYIFQSLTIAYLKTKVKNVPFSPKLTTSWQCGNISKFVTEKKLLIQRGGGTGPSKPRQPRQPQVPTPAETAYAVILEDEVRC